MFRVAGGLIATTSAAVALHYSSRSKPAQSHCQVPCGIYADNAKVEELAQHATTVLKATNEINTLVPLQTPQSVNQSVRWVVTKEDHCNKIQHEVSDYFLTQRVVDVAAGHPDRQKYLEKLAMHHQVLRAAMKAKQSADPKVAKHLQETIHDLGHLYNQ
eukprot:m.258825 g.258825  ORF g.258825 m.258825 type:complete len:159 (+) comp37161_c0_seq1:72-548(+)